MVTTSADLVDLVSHYLSWGCPELDVVVRDTKKLRVFRRCSRVSWLTKSRVVSPGCASGMAEKTV
jgi:hypothetical protein